MRAETTTTDVEKQIVGSCPAIRQAISYAKSVARANGAVLILGESGTGKEHFGRLIHEASPRAKAGAIYTINCAALPETLAETELFGHEKGAFTGAHAAKPGLFELADCGTLILDELAELSLANQAKLLRVLQDRRYLRVGGTKYVSTTARIVAMTNADLEQRVKDGSFREDLYHRLNAYRIELPPLRERGRDVVLIARHLLEAIDDLKILAEDRGGRLGLSRKSEQALLDYSWPGNVRELQQCLRAAFFACRARTLTGDHLIRVLPAGDSEPGPGSLCLEKQLLGLLGEEEAVASSVLKQKLGIGWRRLTALLDGLRASGRVTREGNGPSTRYRLVEAQAADPADLVVELARKEGRIQRSQVCEVTGLPPRSASRLLNSLVDSGTLMAEGGRGRGRTYKLET